MRFDSPSAADDEAYPERDGQFALPDDLALLGEQLHDDAQRLSACYPAPVGPVIEIAAVLGAVSGARSKQDRRRPWIVSTAVGGVVAIALLVLLGLAGGNMLDLFSPGKSDSQPVATGMHAITPNRSVSAHSLGTTPRPVPESDAMAPLSSEWLVPAEFSATVPSVTPAVFRGGITGPEMEGWMDLRQDELQADRDSLEF